MAGDGGRVPDVSEQRAEVDVVRLAVKDARTIVLASLAGNLTRAKLMPLVEALDALPDDARDPGPASVLAALLAESPEATAAAIEALLATDEALSEMENVWVKLGTRDGLFGSVGLLDDASKRRLVSAACRSLLSKAPMEDGDA